VITTQPRIGVMFCREYLPELIPAYARMTEASGLDDLWIIEDAFFNGGLSAAAVALASTNHIHVGIGIQPAVVRNVAYNAMDLATVARIFPGRFEIGLGHGVAGWMKQVGEFPHSQMGALGDRTLALRQLLRGETVSADGPDIHLDGVRLEFPPEVVPNVSLGVIGPKGLQLSGRVADGTILVELTGPALVRKDLDIIRQGQADAGRSGEVHQITVFAYWSQNADGDTARNAIRPILARRINPDGMRDLVAPGFAEAAQAMIDRGGTDLLAKELPDAWIDEIAVAGTPAECAAAIRRLGDAGVHRVGLVPPLEATVEQISKWATDLAAVYRT
jgi:5,10-methylenetetrahydromethanopterin reductase